MERIDKIPGISANSPQAGMFVMVKVEQVASTGMGFATGVLEHGGVSVLPGAAFGASTEHFVRLSLTHPINIMSKAFDRIESYVASLK